MKIEVPTAVKKVVLGSVKTANRERVGGVFLFRFLKGEDDEAEDKIPEEGDKIPEDDGPARISGANIVNQDIIVLP